MSEPYWEPLSAIPPPSPTVITAATVAGLGTPFDGKLGLLRVADTYAGDYDTVPLIYDATMGKWVSSEWTLLSTTGYGGYTQGRINNLIPASVTPAAALNNVAQMIISACGKFVQAGLTLMTRCAGLVVRNTAADVVQVYVLTDIFGGLDVAPVAGSAPPMYYNRSGGSTVEWFDSPWYSDANGAAFWAANSTRQHLRMNLRLDNATANRAIEWGGSIKARWVST